MTRTLRLSLTAPLLALSSCVLFVDPPSYMCTARTDCVSPYVYTPDADGTCTCTLEDLRDAGLTDAGQPDAGSMDAGTTQMDAGQPDAGSMDAGTTEMDAGTAGMDAGTTEMDAGTAEMDAGTAEMDAGDPTPDAGMADAGTAEMDAGQPDAGMADAGQPDAGATCMDDDSLAMCDPDSDGLTNAEETMYGTDPYDNDSDGDGLDDHTEVTGPSSPLSADTDTDGWCDGPVLVEPCFDINDPDPTDDAVPGAMQDAGGAPDAGGPPDAGSTDGGSGTGRLDVYMLGTPRLRIDNTVSCSASNAADPMAVSYAFYVDSVPRTTTGAQYTIAPDDPPGTVVRCDGTLVGPGGVVFTGSDSNRIAPITGLKVVRADGLPWNGNGMPGLQLRCNVTAVDDATVGWFRGPPPLTGGGPAPVSMPIGSGAMVTLPSGGSVHCRASAPLPQGGTDTMYSAEVTIP